MKNIKVKLAVFIFSTFTLSFLGLETLKGENHHEKTKVLAANSMNRVEQNEVKVIADKKQNISYTIIEYKVKSGDTLYNLSQRFYETGKFERFLRYYNNIDRTNMINVGETLLIPIKGLNDYHADYEHHNNDSDALQEIQLHKVKLGDTVYSISKKYYNTSEFYEFIAIYNNLADYTKLKLGQELMIPKHPPVEWHQDEEQIHEVTAGDTLYSLSLRYYDTPHLQEYIAESNHLQNTNQLQTGTTLIIPANPF